MQRILLFIAVCVIATGCETMTTDSPPASSPVPDEEEDVEYWGCGDSYYGCVYRRCPVKLMADFNTGSGTVEIAGRTKYTRFELAGLLRRWDWGLDDDFTYDYAFVLDTDGDARYYDFSGMEVGSRSKPSDFYKCQRK